MNTTHATLAIATALERRGFTATAVHVATPDGRTWEVRTTASGYYRLFELPRNANGAPEEHDAVEANEWEFGELLDYLDAVGRTR